MQISLARVRDEDAPSGFRVLADRLWPRGLAKADAHLELWAKELAPSTELRRWYHADRKTRHDEFARRYLAELDASPHDELLDTLRSHDHVLLLTDSREPGASHLPVLAGWLDG